MTVAVRIGLFAAGLAVLFAGSFAAGAAVDPDAGGGDAPAHGESSAHGERDAHDGGAAQGGDAPAPRRLVVEPRRFEPGVAATRACRVVDRDGRTVESFDVEHERAMHVISARHDLTGYRHVHPRRTADGGWEVDVAFPQAGPQRVFADFVSRGRPYTLSADVDVAGAYAPRALPAVADIADAGDGYTVAVTRAGGERRFTVAKDGAPVDDVEPYLGARGHLVALRAGDIAFQHVHPKDSATEGRQIRFDVALPDGGRYRLFLQFKHAGEVHTAAFTERAAGDGAAHGEDGHAH